MEDNPYRSPAAAIHTATRTPTLRAEGNYLVVSSDARLPPRCIKTNQPVTDDDAVRRNLYWCSPWVVPLILVSGCIMILVYFLVRKKITLTFGLHPDQRRRYRRRMIVTVLVLVGSVAVMPMASESGPMLITVLVNFCAAVAYLLLGTSPVSVGKYRDGLFWISGCCREFLDEIDAAAGTQQSG